MVCLLVSVLVISAEGVGLLLLLLLLTSLASCVMIVIIATSILIAIDDSTQTSNNEQLYFGYSCCYYEGLGLALRPAAVGLARQGWAELPDNKIKHKYRERQSIYNNK